jgi:hypothetical protein
MPWSASSDVLICCAGPRKPPAGHHLLRSIIGLDAARWSFNIEQVINQE